MVIQKLSTNNTDFSNTDLKELDNIDTEKDYSTLKIQNEAV